MGICSDRKGIGSGQDRTENDFRIPNGNQDLSEFFLCTAKPMELRSNNNGQRTTDH
jgi:hypothetical protein